MFSLLYDLSLLLLGVIAMPKFLWGRICYGKYRESLPSRLGKKLPNISEKKDLTIWISTISVGEARAALPLFKKLREAYPNANIVISSVTETGHTEAKRCMKEANAHFFMPLDFSWIIKKTLARVKPDILIVVESDFWYHLMHFAKKQGTKILLVNGKMSERSLHRFKKFSFFTKKLFSHFDHLYVQSSRYKERFVELGVDPAKITSTGNLKLDVVPKLLTSLEKKQWREELGIKPEDLVLVIGSTHAPEEEDLLTSLSSVWKALPHLKVLLVPRHPERFSEVKELITSKNIPFISYTDRAKKTGSEKVILIDAMGILNSCYQLAQVAIVAGSYTDKVGGHNIFEPVVCGVPVLFGPHMYTQMDLVDIVQSAQAGKQVSLNELPSLLIHLFQDKEAYQKMQEACLHATQEAQGSTERTWKLISPYLTNNVEANSRVC